MNRKRIFLNIVATYGRSLVGLGCGVFTGRWVLMALGESDFGVWSVVGGLAAFVTFFNMLFAGATGRFFAYSVERTEDCRDWFRTAVVLHLALASVLVVVGYPVGTWFVRHGLEIPTARAHDAIIIFRLVCFSCWIGMATVPFVAMYTARQNIAELSVYGLLQSVAHFLFLGYAVSHPRDWLVAYAAVLSGINIVPNLLMAVGAVRRYEVCRGWGRVIDFGRRFREIGVYAFWQIFGGLGILARTQGLNVLLNRLAGTGANAAFGIASQVNGQVQSLSAALQGAFAPVITTAFGSGEKTIAQRYSFRACRLSLVLMLVFAIPLMLELPTVLRLWLVQPPNGAAILCWSVLAAVVVDKATCGHAIALNANGRIGGYQIVVGMTLVLTLPLAWGLFRAGFGLAGVGMALVIGSILAGLGRVLFAKRLLGFGIWMWLREIILPTVALMLVAGCAGCLARVWLNEGLMRVVVTTICSLTAFLPFTWFGVLSEEEKQVLKQRLKFNYASAPTYAARTRDFELLKQSSSGGIFSELARETLKRGGVVFGAAYEKGSFRVRHIAVRDEAGLARLRGSKYLRSELGDTADQVCAELATGNLVLFSGTPCQVAAVSEEVKANGADEQQMTRLLLVEVACHGVPQREIVEKYFKGSPKVNFRDKSLGWKSYGITIQSSTVPWWQNAFMKGYVANLFLEEGCTHCPFKDGKSGADLTLGDYWNASDRFPAFADDRGVSVVVVRTSRGAKAWSDICGQVQWEKSDWAHASQGNPALVRSFAAHRKARHFSREIKRGVAFEVAVDQALRPWWRRVGSAVKKSLIG